MEYQPNSYKVTMLLPLFKRLHEKVSEETLEWAQNELTRLRQGWTRLGKVKGYWHGDTDENIMVFVILTNPSDDDISALKSFLRECRQKNRFDQQAMYWEMVPVYYEEIQ